MVAYTRLLYWDEIQMYLVDHVIFNKCELALCFSVSDCMFKMSCLAHLQSSCPKQCSTTLFHFLLVYTRPVGRVSQHYFVAALALAQQSRSSTKFVVFVDPLQFQYTDSYGSSSSRATLLMTVPSVQCRQQFKASSAIL